MTEKNKERQAFEAWMRRDKPDMPLYRRDMPGSERFGQYCSMLIEDQWQAWQARAALQAGEREPVSYDSNMRAIAQRNLVAYLGKASFSSNVDRHAALNCVEVLAAPAPAASPAALTDALAQIGAILGPGDNSLSTLLVCIQNIKHFSDCLDAIEREFFMVPGEPDEDDPDGEPSDECLLNRWGSTVEQYVEQFRAAIPHLLAAQPAADAPSDMGQDDISQDCPHDTCDPAACQCAEPAALTLPDRVIDVLMQTAGVDTFHPDGDQLEKLHAFAHAITTEVLARLPAEPAHPDRQGVALSDEEIAAIFAKHTHGLPTTDRQRTVAIEIGRAILSRASSSRAEVEKNAARYLAIKPYLRIDDIGDDEFVYGLMVESEGLEEAAANAIAWGREIDGSVDAAIDALAAAEAPKQEGQNNG